MPDIVHGADHSRATIDHGTIREWVEDRGGEPATVASTADGGAGVLRLQFPDTKDDHEELEPVDWDAFFRKFDEADLAFVYQEETADGNTSRFYKFVDRKTVAGR